MYCVPLTGLCTCAVPKQEAKCAYKSLVLQMEKQLLEHTLQQVLELQPAGQLPGSCRPPTTSTSEESRPAAPATPSAPAEAPKDGQANNAQVRPGCFLPMHVTQNTSCICVTVVYHHTLTGITTVQCIHKIARLEVSVVLGFSIASLPFVICVACCQENMPRAPNPAVNVPQHGVSVRDGFPSLFAGHAVALEGPG